MLESVCEYQGKIETEKRFYISSLETDARHISSVIRSHWGVENGLHVAFNEDKCKIRTGYSAENLSTVRRIVLNILKQDKTRKIGLARKRRLAAINISYMENLICQ